MPDVNLDFQDDPTASARLTYSLTVLGEIVQLREITVRQVARPFQP
jgi:hypothetical protein